MILPGARASSTGRSKAEAQANLAEFLRMRPGSFADFDAERRRKGPDHSDHRSKMGRGGAAGAL